VPLGRAGSRVKLRGYTIDLAEIEAALVAVAHVFVELLKLDGAGPHDDFFLLGGDSVMAAELVTRIEAAFGVRVGELQHGATVAAIATRIRLGLAPASRG
jgi:acyl carrier protein